MSPEVSFLFCAYYTFFTTKWLIDRAWFNYWSPLYIASPLSHVSACSILHWIWSMDLGLSPHFCVQMKCLTTRLATAALCL
jgi:hypothetical protein